MNGQDRAGASDRRVLRLNPAFDPGSMRPSSVEFFLLSRIDGRTPWCILREMGGMTVEESDLCLESWLAAGYVQVSHVDGIAEGPTPFPFGASSSSLLSIDPELDLDVATQQRVKEMLLLLGQSDPSLLGVSADTDEKNIKRAYFKLSREFHPDRFFRRELGPYRVEIERLFKAIQRAYVNLSKSRSDLSIGRSSNQRRARSSSSNQGGLLEEESVRKRPASDPVQNEHYQKARELMKAAAESMEEGRFEEARQCLQIAEKFCPEYPSLSQAMADVLMNLKKMNHSMDTKSEGGDSRLSDSTYRGSAPRRSVLSCRGET